MNDDTRMQLRKIVERAVRPVRASAARLHRIREELLAHATAAFDEEFERLGDESLAVQRVVQRFGDAAELSRELEQDMPRSERLTWWWERLVRVRVGESAARRALRHGLLAMAFQGGLAVAATPVLLWKGREYQLPFVYALALAFALVVSVFTWIVSGLRAALYGEGPRSFTRAALLLALAPVAVASAWLFQSLAIDGNASLLLDPVCFRSMACLSGLSIPGLVLLARQSAREIGRAREWSILQLDA